MENPHYAGFWIRFCATMIDSVIILLITWPVLYYFYGFSFLYGTKFVQGPVDIVISYVLPILLTIYLWIKFKGTPGKTMLGLQIVDLKTGGALNLKQSIVRYFGYFIMVLPLCLGFVLIAFDKRKQGWHDKMASSAVVYKKSLLQEQSH
jgi:uncharacterized RDD family membrane protein YckC